MKTIIRFCKSCKKNTLHDDYKSLFHGEKSSAASRLFLGICTAGFSEIASDRILECQECGIKKNL